MYWPDGSVMQKVTIRFPQEKKITAGSKTMLIQPDGQSVNRRKLHLFPLGNSSMHNVSFATACSSTIRILRFEITVGSGCGNMLPLLLLLHVLRPRLASFRSCCPTTTSPQECLLFPRHYCRRRCPESANSKLWDHIRGCEMYKKRGRWRL